MIIIIDGYNLLKTVRSGSIGDQQRIYFINQLISYVRCAGNRVIVVFDGGEDSRPSSLSHHGVTETYSGYKQSADSVIQDLLEKNAQREVLLVSTDRALNRYAENLDIPSMDSAVFYSLLRDRLQNKLLKQPAGDVQRKSQIHKIIDGSSSSELDQLMEEGTKKMFHKYADKDSNDTKSARYSKKDKRLTRLVKKL